MRVSLETGRPSSDRGIAPAQSISARSILRTLRKPANGLLCGTVIAGWLALVAWTGTGPEGWQARVCTDLTLESKACGGLRGGKDTGRIAPHTASLDSAS